MINVRTRQLIKYVLMLETLPLAGDEFHELMENTKRPGLATPSADDKKLTRDIVKAGAIMGIPCYDHIIIGDGSYYSFQEDEQM